MNRAERTLLIATARAAVFVIQYLWNRGESPATSSVRHHIRAVEDALEGIGEQR